MATTPIAIEWYRETYRGIEFVISHRAAYDTEYAKHRATLLMTVGGRDVQCPAAGDVDAAAKKARAYIDKEHEDQALLPRLVALAASSTTGKDVPAHIGGEFTEGDIAWAWALGGRVRRGLVVKVTRTRVTIAYTTPSNKLDVRRKTVAKAEVWREKAAPVAPEQPALPVKAPAVDAQPAPAPVSAIADATPAAETEEELPAEVEAAASGEVIVTQDGPGKQVVWLDRAVIGTVFDESAAGLDRGAFAAWSPRGGGRNSSAGFHRTAAAAVAAIGHLYGVADTVRGSLPMTADHPDVAAARAVLHKIKGAVLSDAYDPEESDGEERGFMLDPRGDGRVAVYWLEGGSPVRRDSFPNGPHLDVLAETFRKAGWDTEDMLKSSQRLFVHVPHRQWERGEQVVCGDGNLRTVSGMVYRPGEPARVVVDGGGEWLASECLPTPDLGVEPGDLVEAETVSLNPAVIRVRVERAPWFSGGKNGMGCVVLPTETGDWVVTTKSVRVVSPRDLSEAGTDVLHEAMAAEVEQLPAGHPVRRVWERLDGILTAGKSEVLPAPWADVTE